MLGYGAVSLSGNPTKAPQRTLLPGRIIPNQPDNQGATGRGTAFFNAAPAINRVEKGEPALVHPNFDDLPDGVNYSGIRAGIASLSDGGAGLIYEARRSIIAQGAKLFRNQHFNLQGLTRRIAAPDAQSQTETGYTLPLQWFAYRTKNYYDSPAGKASPGSSQTNKQPTLKKPAPTASIPTSMPWNVSAPGVPY